MKSLCTLWRYMAEELAIWCRTSTIHDYNTVVKRSEQEGVSFLTITLPSFGKDFEKSLDEGYIDSSSFRAFARVKGGAIPAFLQGMTGQVFDRQTGRLVDKPNIDCIRAIRQLALMFSKVLLDCTEERERASILGYINCEKEVRDADEGTSMETLNELSAMSALLFGNIYSEVERKLLSDELLPKHGPGKTADRLTGNRKFDLQEYPERLDHSFSYESYGLPSPRFINGFYPEDDTATLGLNRVTLLEPGAERPVRVVSVPKTLKTRRIIAIEPTAMQWAQQALLEAFVGIIENPYVPNSFFKSRRNRVFGMIGFTDQVPNQDMAKKGSLDGELATLDLSEASDRVSNKHVMAMFSRNPDLMIAIQDCRSTKAYVDGYGVQHLAKFASMGSALTFPMEAMVFTTIIFLGIQDALSRSLTEEDILSFSDKVRVYGDDLIIPKDYVQSVMNRLSLYGYKVNHNKSFWTGLFRESCGKEFYAGADVSIQRVRREFPSSRLDVWETISLVSLRNRLFSAGYVTTVEWLDKQVENILPHYPLVRPTSPIMGRWSYHESDFDSDKTHGDYQSPLVKGYRVVPRPPASPVSGQGALLKYFVKRGHKPFDVDHLERQGRPPSVDIKLGWSSPS